MATQMRAEFPMPRLEVGSMDAASSVCAVVAQADVLEARHHRESASEIAGLGVDLLRWVLSRPQTRPERQDTFGDQLAALD
ncbi:MAG: hypothetical protein JF593_13720 [Novosphingobium sp.]|nr:hypothetical protein [Novosphingobium sp.]